MRLAPISKHDQAVIIRAVANGASWRGERSGHRVSLWRDRTLWGGHVEYNVYRPGQVAARGRADTVAKAVDEINALIRRGTFSTRSVGTLQRKEEAGAA